MRTTKALRGALVLGFALNGFIYWVSSLVAILTDADGLNPDVSAVITTAILFVMVSISYLSDRVRYDTSENNQK